MFTLKKKLEICLLLKILFLISLRNFPNILREEPFNILGVHFTFVNLEQKKNYYRDQKLEMLFVKTAFFGHLNLKSIILLSMAAYLKEVIKLPLEHLVERTPQSLHTF